MSQKLPSHSQAPLNQEEEALLAVGEQVLSETKRCGATSADISLNQVDGLSYTVRNGEPETVEKNKDKGLNIRVFFGDQTGSASTTDYSHAALKASVEAAMAIAKVTQGDPCLRLATPDLFPKQWVDLDQLHPQAWTGEHAAQAALDYALRCEQAALSVDSRITNTEGATFNAHAGTTLTMSSEGFCGFSRGSRYGLSASVIAGEKDKMQRDYWYDGACSLDDLPSAESIGKKAGQRTVARLGAKKIKTQSVPVLYDATVASSLLGHLMRAISGGAVYKKASFLADRLGEVVFPEFINIHESPHLTRVSGSSLYDSDGVATTAQHFIENGVLNSYALSLYSACKMGTTTTANAGGARNVSISSSGKTQAELLKDMGKGLLITEMMGFGSNIITGDYSRGASGFWVENGEIQYPVEEITVSGNLKDMYQGIVSVGNDVDLRGNIRSGSILLDQLMVGGL